MAHAYDGHSRPGLAKVPARAVPRTGETFSGLLGAHGLSQAGVCRRAALQPTQLRETVTGVRQSWQLDRLELAAPALMADFYETRASLLRAGAPRPSLPPERHICQLVARLGELSHSTDAALADGVLSADERRGLVSQLRALAERVGLAERDLETGT